MMFLKFGLVGSWEEQLKTPRNLQKIQNTMSRSLSEKSITKIADTRTTEKTP
jgi:hypothetical protein